ncbi:hypothetical protein [Duganella guangzhouensis]
MRLLSKNSAIVAAVAPQRMMVSPSAHMAAAAWAIARARARASSTSRSHR